MFPSPRHAGLGMQGNCQVESEAAQAVVPIEYTLTGTPELLLILEMIHRLEGEKVTMTLTHRDKGTNDSYEDANVDYPFEVDPSLSELRQLR